MLAVLWEWWARSAGRKGGHHLIMSDIKLKVKMMVLIWFAPQVPCALICDDFKDNVLELGCLSLALLWFSRFEVI